MPMFLMGFLGGIAFRQRHPMESKLGAKLDCLSVY